MPLDSLPQEVECAAWIRRVHAVLRRAFRRAGRGSIKRVEAALGISKGSFRQWRRRGRLELDMLFRALAELGVDPGCFWVEVFGGELDPLQLAKRPTGPPKDPVVRHAVARWQGPPPSGSATMTEERWRQLDALRGEDPGLAVKRIKAALKTAEKPWIPRLLAAYGSARRAQAQLDQAVEALHYALLLAEDSDSRSVCADILQRLGVAYAYTGNHALGLLFAKEAAYEHCMASNARGEGRSWVDQASRYGSLGRFDDAIAASNAALSRLPKNEFRHRFAAYHCLASVHLQQGQRRKATKFAMCAEELEPNVSADLIGALNTMKAEMAITDGEFPEAERFFTIAIESHRRLSPIDAALASVDLVRIQILRGRMNHAVKTIKSMAAFLERLKENPLASEAILQLIRLTLTGGRITIGVLDQVSHKLNKARARLFARARGGPNHWDR